jgi:pyroglutamyl-peptidase
MKLLLTAFEPFGGHQDNSSRKIVENIELDDANITLFKEYLPVIFQQSVYEEIIMKHQPDVILLCGQAEGRKYVEIEQFAMNYMDAMIPDNQNIWMKNQRIIEDGPLAYQTTIPAYSIVRSLESSYPIRLSLSAGAYVCNYAFYQSLRITEEQHLKTQVGFIHFPLFEGQNNPKSFAVLPLDKMIQTLSMVLKTLQQHG